MAHTGVQTPALQTPFIVDVSLITYNEKVIHLTELFLFLKCEIKEYF